jgi:hypothetical protein
MNGNSKIVTITLRSKQSATTLPVVSFEDFPRGPFSVRSKVMKTSRVHCT